MSFYYPLKFIQGSGTSGTSKSAGLPNITGYYYDYRSYIYEGGTGAFTGSYGKNEGGASYSSNGTNGGITFNASNSNTIYGGSSTVQPPSLTMRYYIKY